MPRKKITQGQLILEFFRNNPGRDIPTAEAVDWAVKEYERRCGLPLRDPDRFIRQLAQQGRLIKVRKGVYRYQGATRVRVLEDFDAKTKMLILDRDGHRCVVCGRGKPDGVDLQVDHLIPKDRGGQATADNGQTLCAQHNFQKKNYDCTEFGLRLFKRLRVTAARAGDQRIVEFCDEVIAIFGRHGLS